MSGPMDRLFHAIDQRCPGFVLNLFDVEREKQEWAAALKERGARNGEDALRHCLGYALERLKPEPLPDLWAFLAILDFELRGFAERDGVGQIALSKALRGVEQQARSPEASAIAQEEMAKMRAILRGEKR